MEQSRQVQRAEFRQEVARGVRMAKARFRKERQKALLERQTEREKSGAYAGRGTKAAVSPSRSRINKRLVKKGQPFARILTAFTYTSDGREFTFHATKGWRSHRA